MGFGSLHLTGSQQWGDPPDREGAKRLVRRAYELGVNFIDTADSYGPHTSERVIRDALHPYPADLLIGTKGGKVRPAPEVWQVDGRPEHLRRALEGSLRDLGVETIDLYQFHEPDPRVPFEESVGALIDFKREGKIRYIGISNVSVGQLQSARAMTEIVSVQNAYNIASRDSEGVLSACDALGIPFMPWHPLAPRKFKQLELSLAEVARVHNATPAQIALAWLLARRGCW